MNVKKLISETAARSRRDELSWVIRGELFGNGPAFLNGDFPEHCRVGVSGLLS